MNIPNEYKTGNPGMDKLIAKTLVKESRQRVVIGVDHSAGKDRTVVVKREGFTVTSVSSFYVFNITPIGKPRMTRRDKYAKIRTAAAAKYFTWRNEFEALIREQGFQIGDGVQVIFLMPMYPTWSKAKKDAMRGTPHQVKPDADNMLKGFIDVCSKADQSIYEKHALKFWWDTGKIIVVRNKPLYKDLNEIPGVCSALQGTERKGGV